MIFFVKNNVGEEKTNILLNFPYFTKLKKKPINFKFGFHNVDFLLGILVHVFDSKKHAFH